jgi:hypothetical protein
MATLRVESLHPRRAAFMAVAACLVVASSALASSFAPKLVLHRNPPGLPMVVSNIATQHRNIAVTWTDTPNPGTINQYSWMRWSTDGGQTFAPRLALNNGDGAVSARAAICGGYAWALTSNQPDPATMSFALDGQKLDGSAHWLGAFDKNVSVPVAGGITALDSTFTCVGDRQLAATWTDPSTSPARMKVGIRPLWPCAQNPGPSCDPGPSYTFDLGQKRLHESPYIAATTSAIYAIWMKDNGDMRFEHFSVASDGTVIAHPMATLLHATSAQNPIVAAFGSRVVIGYNEGGKARVKVSTNWGASFGADTVLAPEAGGEPQAGMESVDVKSRGRILIEVAEGSCITCYGIDFSVGFLSTDGGATWTNTSSHLQSNQVGAFFGAGDALMIAEAWDQSQTGASREKIQFHVGTI